MAKSKNTTSHRKQVAAFGAAMGTLAVGQAPPAQAAVINLQSAGIGNILIPFNSTISYGNVPATLETIGGIDVLGFEGGNFYFTFPQYGGGLTSGKGIGGFFTQFPTSHPLTTGSIPGSNYCCGAISGSFTLGFKGNLGIGTGQPGWFQVSFGSGWGDDITFLAGAIETTGSTIHVGTSAAVPEPAAGGLIALGLLAMGARGVRRSRRNRKQAASDVAAP